MKIVIERQRNTERIVAETTTDRLKFKALKGIIKQHKCEF